MSVDRDHGEVLCDTVRRAFERGERLRIVAGGSKTFLTPSDQDAGATESLLSVADHRGVLEYRPEELVITARAGTPLEELERVLAEADQHLPFEPPRFHGGGTLGGAVACGLAGPARPWRGGVRDVVLGVELANGRGERLRFGGQVMKNVAGYDVGRLQAGAFGTLGLLLAVSLKVLPRPAVEETRAFELGAEAALERCRGWARQSLPLTATCWHDGVLRVRLSGSEPAVRQAGSGLGGEVEAGTPFWMAVRDHRLEFLSDAGLWRCSLPPAAPAPLERCLVSWGGAERWWRPPPDVGDAADRAGVLAGQGGHGRPFDHTFGIRDGAYVSELERKYAARLKLAFDPGGVLNPALCRVTETARAD